MTNDIDVYKRRYDREKSARQQAELLLETKSTELYRLNEALTNLTADLEQKVLQRTQELKTARDQAVASNEAKSLFLANMSHEIRTPMNGILGVVHLLESSPLSEHQHRLLNTAKESGELLLAIINDILDVSKIEAGELTLEHIYFDIAETINSVADTFLIAAQQKNLSLTRLLDSQIPRTIAGDPTRVRQVLYNLINNAIKFTQQGSITISAKMCDDQFIEISVSDTGIGIAPDKIAHIFSPFAQADNSITRKFGGTGLGLAICSHFTKKMGREIRASSTLGQGSIFTFWLDTNATPNEAIVQAKQPLESAPQFVENLIMLVDDNPVNREIGSEILRAQGLIVDCFENGQEALDALPLKEYRAVLMDVQMPVMDGLTATRAIRAIDRYAQLPVIAMTAHARKEDFVKSLDAGMNAHLTKPIEPRKIFSLLQQWIPIVSKTTEPHNLSTESADKNSTTPPNQTGNTRNGIDGFAEIDIKEALLRTNNNRELLQKVLVMFSNTHKDDAEKFAAYLKDNDFEKIQALAHKLKGSSATVGAKKTSQAATQLDKACKEKTYAECNQLIKQTILALESVIQEINSIATSKSPLLE